MAQGSNDLSTLPLKAANFIKFRLHISRIWIETTAFMRDQQDNIVGDWTETGFNFSRILLDHSLGSNLHRGLWKTRRCYRLLDITRQLGCKSNPFFESFVIEHDGPMSCILQFNSAPLSQSQWKGETDRWRPFRQGRACMYCLVLSSGLPPFLVVVYISDFSHSFFFTWHAKCPVHYQMSNHFVTFIYNVTLCGVHVVQRCMQLSWFLLAQSMAYKPH